MSQDIDIDAFRKAYYARMGGQEKSAVTQNLERLAGMAGYVPPDAQPSEEKVSGPQQAEVPDVDWDAVTDMGDIEPLNLGSGASRAPQDAGRETGMALPAERVAKVFEEWKIPIEARADFEAERLEETLGAVDRPFDMDAQALTAINSISHEPLPGSGYRRFMQSARDMDLALARNGGIEPEKFAGLMQNLHALHNSLNTSPSMLKDLSERAGLSYSVVDADKDFALKKIASDKRAEAAQVFLDNILEIPRTAAFLHQLDPVEQLALTSDVALAALEKDLPASERGFFESGYIGAARNAWEYGMMARELGELGIKWMDGSITDEERRRIDVLQKTLGYGQRQRENQALFERMVRGTVEALGVPLYGGLEGAVEFLGRYGKEGLAAGAMVGAGFGTAAGGVGAVPGAIAGGLTGLGAVAQAGFVNDMMRQEGAQTFLTLMDKGVPEELARVLAIGAGAAKGALEYVGLKQLGKVFPGMERFLTPEAASAALNAIRKNPSLAAAVGEGALAFLRGITGETATEVMQEGVDIAAEEVGRRLSGINGAAPTAGEIVGRLAETTVQTVESTALVAVFGGINRGVYQHRRARKLEDALGELQETQGKTLDSVAEAAQKSPVMKDMPGTGEALLDHLAESGVLPKQVFIRPEAVQQTFFQTEDPERMAAAADMGITPESLQENLTLGTDVAVDMSKATAHILKDADLYAALKPDMRLSPEMLTDAEVEDLTAMSADAQARLDYLNDILAPLSEEAEAAENRYQQRMEIAGPYMEQWRAAGYTENQAEAFGLVLAASAERMAPLFGKTPQEYLEERLAGYFRMSEREFENLSADGLGAMHGKGARPESMEQAAMYPARDADLSSFISRVREEGGKKKPSYYVLTGGGIPEDAEVRVTSALVLHQAKGHPDMTLEDNEKLPAIVAGIDGENTKRLSGTWTYGTRFRGMQEIDGTTYGYVFDIAPKGTVNFITFFKDTPKAVRNWFQQPERKKKKASKVPVDHAEAHIHDSGYPLGKPSEKRLSDFIAEVKGQESGEQKQATPLSQGAGSSPARPSPQTRDVIPEPERNGLTEETVTSDAARGNAQEMAGAQEEAQDTGTEGTPRKPDDKTPLAWWMMMDENYLSQNALMDMDMTRMARDTWFLSSDKTKLPVLTPSGMRFDDFREGLSRWRKKYPDSPGFKEIEEHLDWIEAQNAALGLDPINAYYQTEQEQTAEEKLAQDVAAWEQQVEALEKGSLDMRAEMTMLSQTPLVMQLVGAKDLPVKIAPGKLKKAMAKHGLSYDVIRQIPGALADPIMIFASATHAGDLVMMLDIRDSAQNGATVNVPIALSLTDSGGYEANIATTAFGRRKDSKGAPDNEWFARQVERGNLLYRNNKKSRDWARTSGVQFPGANSRSTSAGRKVLTDEDLVKLREGYPTYYQHEDGRTYPHNGKAVGQITPEVAATLRLNKPGPIVLDDVGLAHIEERHGKEIREKGFKSIESFISYVLNNFDFVYNGNRENSYQLVLRSKSPYPRIIISLQLKRSGNFYRINTAHFIRADTYKNKTPLWERAQSSHSEEPLALVSGQSGVEKNIASRRQDGKDSILHQTRKPIEVSSKALGVPEGSDIREYRKAAKKFHDQILYESLHGKPVFQPELTKPVRFSRASWGKNRSEGARPEKWMLFPYLREIIETSKLYYSEDIKDKPGYIKRHVAINTVSIDGKVQTVIFSLLEDKGGNLFYNIADDMEKTSIGKALHELPAERTLGHEGLHQDEVSPGENKITPDPDGVNLHIFESRPAGRAQGAIRQMEDGRYVVGLFKSKNASTVLHETAHFWLEELRRAAGLETAPEWVREAWAKLEKAYGFEGAALTPETWREVQERFAREFEAYAREGKAPSWELQTAFSRFRNWLSDIYRSIKTILGVHAVSPEVREVFDALLATDEEIEQSRRAVERGSVMERLGGEVAPELRDKYARAVQKAHENAQAVIANRRLVDRRKAERNLREKATAAIDGSETYKLIARLREEGIPFDALKGAISEDLAYRLREKWRRARGEGRALIRKGGTLDILDVAAQFNEDTAQGLAAVLLDTPTRREAIDAQVEAGLAEWDAAYDAEVEYSSAYDEVLALEMEALTGERQVSPAALRRQMDERIDARKMSQVDAEYQALKARLRSEERSTRRAAREARQESNAAWRERMAELKEKERLRRAALGAAYRARLERDAIVRQLRKVGDSKTVPYDYMCQIRRLLGRFDGLGTPGQRLDPETLSKLPTLQEFVAGITGPFGESVTAPEWLLGDKAGRFSDLSLEEMREVKRLIMEIAHAGRTEGRMLADAEKRAIREVAEGCAEQMGTLSQRKFISERTGLLDTVRGALRKGLSSITSMRFLARWMDGFAQGGVNQKAWFMPLQQALSDELTLKREMEQLLRAAVTPLLRVGRLTEAFAIDGVPLQEDVQRLWKGLFDMDKVYSVALNMGNAGNLKALMTGYGWSEADLARITGRLTAEEWQAIQAVWDTINTLYPRLDATYRALKGVPLPKVKAQAFTVVTADGQRLRLKGGYYPLIFDQRLSGKAAENQSVDEMLNGPEAVLRTPNPKSGMTNARKGGTLPPLLSMTVIDRHVADTIHYITHALPLRDTMRLFREPAFKAAFVNAAGQENYDQLLPWLRGIARPDGEQMHGIMKAMDWMAKRGTMFAMGLNMKSALLQLTSIGNSWSEVGTGNFMRAAATLLSGPRESWAAIRRKSAYMQSRAQFMDESLRREYAEMRANGVGGVRFRNARYALGVVQKAQFALISALDTAVAAPTWLAAYDRAIARGAEESAAVAEADAAVVAAQGGGGALDTPAVMRQAGIMRILCPFMSFALSDFNRKLETVRGLREYQKTGNSAISYGRAFSDFALQWVMPVVLSCLMVGLGRDDEWPDAEDYGWEALTFFTMGIPLARDVARMAQDQFSGSGFKGGRTPLAFTGVDNLLRGAKHARQALVDDKADAGYLALKESLNAVGFFLGIGTPQIWRTVEGSEAYFVDDEGGVLAPLLGKPGKK